VPEHDAVTRSQLAVAFCIDAFCITSRQNHSGSLLHRSTPIGSQYSVFVGFLFGDPSGTHTMENARTKEMQRVDRRGPSSIGAG
jgi:hypothetical protein